MRFKALACCFFAICMLLHPVCLAQTHSQQDWFYPTFGFELSAMFGSARSLEGDAASSTPRPFEALTEPQQKYLSQVLAVWHERSRIADEPEHYFSLKRFDAAYNSGRHPTTQATGYLKFSAPNKWLYRIDNVKWFRGFDQAQQPRNFESRSVKDRSLFYFDGDSLRVLDRVNRKCAVMPNAVTPSEVSSVGRESTSQFPFVVDQRDLEVRYWIRPIANPTGDSNVWIELWPRSKADRRKFSRLQVVLDYQSVSPKGMTVFLANWRPDADHREVYEFSDASK